MPLECLPLSALCAKLQPYAQASPAWRFVFFLVVLGDNSLARKFIRRRRYQWRSVCCACHARLRHRRRRSKFATKVTSLATKSVCLTSTGRRRNLQNSHQWVPPRDLCGRAAWKAAAEPVELAGTEIMRVCWHLIKSRHYR